MDDDVVGIVVGLIILVGMTVLIVTAGTVIAIAAVPAGLGYAYYWHQVKSPKALERIEHERTHKLYHDTRRKFTDIDVPAVFRDHLHDRDDDTYDTLFSIASRLVAVEGLDNYPPAPPEICDSIEGGRYRDFLNQVSPAGYKERIMHIAQLANLCALPPTNDNIAAILLHAVSHDHQSNYLPVTTKQIDQNFVEQKSVTPQEYDGDDIVNAYFKSTPLALMSNIFHDDTVSIPHELRNQHHMIIGGSGHGKTQCLQQMLLSDLEEDACVIVMDSQGGMLERLLHIVSWDRIVYLDGGNIRQPLALAAFEVGSTSEPEDERKVRTAIGLYEHMFASRETQFTTKQSTLYRFLSRFLMEIPGANFNTALDILENGYDAYADHLSQLDETSQSFVTTNLDNPKVKGSSQGYRQTRQEVAQRIYTLLESSTIRRMFNSSESKVDFDEAIRQNRIILINTDQTALGLEGATLFGRYCLAQIAMSVLARPETTERVYFYIDEAQEYLSGDPVIQRLFEQGRKRGLCMVCAFHTLGQLKELSDLMITLTSIKFAGGISASDAGRLAKDMQTDTPTIMDVPPLSFWASFKGGEAGRYRVTPGLLEARIAEEPEDIATLKEMMIDLYHQSAPVAPEEPNKPEPGEETDDERYANHWKDEVDPDSPQDLDDGPAAHHEPPGPDEKQVPKQADPDAPKNLD